MNDEPRTQSYTVKQIRNHQFGVMIIGVILVALFSVFVSLSLYRTSGTMQLDLSRPGYDEARKQAGQDSTVFEGFSPDGDITAKSLEVFNHLFSEKQKEANSLDAFSSDVLNDVALRL